MGPRIKELQLKNYKSIEHCNIKFSPLTLLVGRNGVGKSNILDALRFTSEALQSTLEYAIRERGGIDQVRRKSLGGRPTNPAIAMRLALPDGEAEYAFKIAAVQGGGFRVARERCHLLSGGVEIVYHTRDGEVIEWRNIQAPMPASSNDRLLLVAASGIPQFRLVYDILTRMTFHNLNPEIMKYPQRPEPGERLAHDGHNIASVIKHLQAVSPDRLDRVIQYLNAIGVPISKISHKHAGALETVEVSQAVHVPTGERNSNFDAIALSDGTVRAIGILVSLVSGQGAKGGPTLIGIEEPETALHPAAVGALVDALLEGAEQTQILLTCHSPDMLDHPDIDPSMIRVVLLDTGRTVVGPLSDEKAEMMKSHLMTAGELLRLDQLTPDPREIERAGDAKGTLFEAIQ